MKLLHILLLLISFLVLITILLPGIIFDATGKIEQIPEKVHQNFGQSLAGVEALLGLNGNAIQLYDRLLVKDPENRLYYAKKGELEFISGDYPQALTSYNTAISYDPENPDYLWKKARILQHLGNDKEASDLYDQILSLKKSDSASLTILGDIAVDRGKYLKALSYYDQSLAKDPSDGLTWEKRGDVIFVLLTIPTAGVDADPQLREENLYQQGYTSYQDAKKLNPSRDQIITEKMNSRSTEYTPQSIRELQNRYQQFKYIS